MSNKFWGLEMNIIWKKKKNEKNKIGKKYLFDKNCAKQTLRTLNIENGLYHERQSIPIIVFMFNVYAITSNR